MRSSLNFRLQYTKHYLAIFATSSVLMASVLLATSISITYAQNATQVQRPNANTTTAATNNTTAVNNNSTNNTNTNTNINSISKTATALGNTTIDTFHVKGTINSLGSGLLTGITPVNKSQVYVLGGNWNFDVINGKLKNFKLYILRTSIDGKQLRTYSIQRVSNVTGAIPPFNSSSIFLRKELGFKGFGNIAINGKVTWKSVPIEVYLINDNIVNIHLNAAKTANEFKGLPIYGIVSSITGANNKPIRIIALPIPTPILLSRLNSNMT